MDQTQAPTPAAVPQQPPPDTRKVDALTAQENQLAIVQSQAEQLLQSLSHGSLANVGGLVGVREDVAAALSGLRSHRGQVGQQLAAARASGK